MKNWVLALGISCSVSLSCSLGAVQQNGLQHPPSANALNGIEQELDFSSILGHEVFVDYAYHFLSQLFDEMQLWSEQVRALASRHSNAFISHCWGGRAAATQAFLEKREEHIRLIAFVGMGIYPHKALLDEDNSVEFRRLQQRLFQFYIDCLVCDEQDLEEMERDLMHQLRGFCMRSEDVFFSTTVLGCLGDASTRVEALFRVVPFFVEDEEEDRDLVEAFEGLQKGCNKRLQALFAKTFSHPKLMKLMRDILDIKDDPYLDEREIPPVQEWGESSP